MEKTLENKNALPEIENARKLFLASNNEADLPIVDAHHHYWNIEKNPHPWLTEKPPIAFRYGSYEAICKNYLPDDYDANCTDHKVIRHVVMEGEWNPDDPTGEALWLAELAKKEGTPQAISAQIWLDRENLDETLRAYTSPALKNLVRSVRHKPVCTTRANYHEGWTKTGSMRCPKWREGYAKLEKAGLMFELQAPWWHMPEAVELAEDFPNITIIINHAGLPGTRDQETLKAWRESMSLLTKYSNIHIKLSGIGVKGEAWTTEQQKPVIDALINDFGVSRCMFASNHPVDAIVVSLNDLWLGFKILTRALKPEERLALFCDNAIKLYKLQ